jgi:kynurenine formamidase
MVWQDIQKILTHYPRAGANPLIIKAVGLDNHNTYPIVSDEDANKILVENSATGFLNRCAVVFVR